MTSHGFGHVSRACTVAKALSDIRPEARFGYFLREDYPEMQALVNFLQHNTDGILLSAQDYMTGDWLSELENLLAVQPACRQQTLNGSLQVAQLVSELLST